MMTNNTFSKNIVAWLALAGVAINGGVSLWNANSSSQIKADQIQLANQQEQNELALEAVSLEISRKNQDLSRLKFVNEMLPKAIDVDGKKSSTAIALIQLALSEQEYVKLIDALSASKNTDLKDVANEAKLALSVAEKEKTDTIIRLVQAISSLDRPTRLDAMEKIRMNYIDEPKLVFEILKYLGKGSERALDENGRINALHTLRLTPNNIWTPGIIEYSSEALAHMKNGAENIGPELGPQTMEVLQQVQVKIGRISS